MLENTNERKKLTRNAENAKITTRMLKLMENKVENDICCCHGSFYLFTNAKQQLIPELLNINTNYLSKY